MIFSGKDLFDKAFINIQIIQYLETNKNNPKKQKGTELTVHKVSNESFWTQSQGSQTASIQRTIF